jgi:hypothetical protein
MCVPLDPSIEALVVKGAVETDKFLSGTDPNIETLSWYDPRSRQKKTTNYYYYYPSVAILLGTMSLVTLFYLRQMRYDLARITSKIK